VEITNIITDRSPALQMIFDDTWQRDRELFKKETGVYIPTREVMGKIPDDTLWRAMYKQLYMETHWKSGEVWKMWFYVGFLTDLASSPGIARSMIDNDYKKIVFPAIGHDGLFQTKALGEDESGFHMANLFLIEAFKYYGANWKQVNAVWAAMKTNSAREVYKAREPRDIVPRFELRIEG